MPDDVSAIELWNEALALELPGKLLLVGLTFTDRACTSEQQEQFWGRVVAVDQRAGTQLLLKGERASETFLLPPDMRSIEPASPGEYRLRSTGEVVVDPDYTVTFLIQKSEG